MVAENLYLLTNPHIVDQVKIGIHSGPLNKLYSRYRTSIPGVIIHYFVKNVDAKKLEQAILQINKAHRVGHSSGKPSEWLRLPLDQIVAQLFIVMNDGQYGRMEEKLFKIQKYQSEIQEQTMIVYVFGDDFRGFVPHSFAKENIEQMTQSMSRLSIEEDDQKLSQWMNEHEVKSKKEVCTTAANIGDLEILQLAIDNEYPYDDIIVMEAIMNGDLKILQLLEKKEKLDEKFWQKKTSYLAAEYGHLNILKWLRGNDCPWDARVTAFAAKGGHLNIIKWARANGCNWSKLAYSNASDSGYRTVANWIKKKGGPTY
jgi:hypothetical protein